MTYRVVEVEGGYGLELGGRIVEAILKEKWNADEVCKALNELEEQDSRAPQVSGAGEASRWAKNRCGPDGETNPRVPKAEPPCASSPGHAVERGIE